MDRKIQIFLEFLNSLKHQGQARTIKVFIIPNEPELVAGLTTTQRRSICEKLDRLGVDCYELVNNLKSEYLSRSRGSLFLDGSHLTKEGTLIVAKRIYEELSK